MSAAPQTLRVGLGARGYDIVIGEGLIARAGEILKPHLKRPRVAIVTDAHVEAAHGAALEAALSAVGVSAEAIVLAPGEDAKSFAGLSFVLERLAAMRFERGDLVVAFGGGVVGDLAGLASALFMRGTPFAQIPTTLLAQVDSAVGGKTAINIAAGKNLVGAFHQPAVVIADIALLDTLPARELRAGYAEIVKYGALGDADFFTFLEQNGAALLAGDRGLRARAVRRSLEMKAEIVARDERERGERALLNLGHTFGHALEAAAGFGDAFLHGEAVATGISLAFDYSAARGHCPAADAARVKRVLRNAGLPAGINDAPPPARAAPERLVALMRQDKKAQGGRITLILARGIGAAFIAPDTSEADLVDFLAARLRAN